MDRREIARGLLASHVVDNPREAVAAAQIVDEHLANAQLLVTRSRFQRVVTAGHPFDSLLCVVDGGLVPASLPYSVLPPGFVVGLHECLLERTQATWISSYYALPGAAIIVMPVVVFDDLTQAFPNIERNVQQLVYRRLARFCWTSLSTVGKPRSRVAAAIVSRLVLRDGLRATGAAEVLITQKDLLRLTALSRTSVFNELKSLEDEGLIEYASPQANQEGRTRVVRVAEIERLRALAEEAIVSGVIPQLSRNDPEISGE